MAEALFPGKNRVPFLFRWLDGRMIVDRDFSGELRPGTEILGIDWHPSAEILARLLTIARSDGGNNSKRVASLEVCGKDRYEALDIFLPLFDPGIGERIGLKVGPPGSMEAVILTVSAHDSARREVLGKEVQQLAGADPSKFEMLDGEIAYLRMPGPASCNSQFTQLLRDHKLGTFVSQPTPGNLRGIIGGFFPSLYFPGNDYCYAARLSSLSAAA
ncbi:MAG: hypothetical protein U0800_09480 [Isosphaeraceae bacterium]